MLMKGLFYRGQKMAEIQKIGEFGTEDEEFFKMILETLENKGFLYEVYRKFNYKHFDIVIYKIQ